MQLLQLNIEKKIVQYVNRYRINDKDLSKIYITDTCKKQRTSLKYGRNKQMTKWRN